MNTKSRIAELERDAVLGRIAMRFVDRAGDVHPGIDDAKTICAEFYDAMSCAVCAKVGMDYEMSGAIDAVMAAKPPSAPVFEAMGLGPMPAFPSIRGGK